MREDTPYVYRDYVTARNHTDVRIRELADARIECNCDQR